MSDLIGQSLGRYHILEQLGEGGMATVYKAYDTRLETDVAIKVIRTEALPQNAVERALKRFEREAKALARLNHHYIVKVMDYGEYEGKPYLVMPYFPGGTLKQKLSQPVDWQEAIGILLPIAEALDYAHSQNMVHRDVKPSNILLTERGQPMLTDFGIAKVLDVEETMDLTGTSAAVGTPEYMAPEQAIAKTADHRADIYALGIVLYEMVTGRKPYTADTPMAVMIMHARDPLPRPTKFVSHIPDVVEKLLLKALAKDPADRYQSMAEVVAAMAGLLRGTGKQAVKAKAPNEKKEKPQREKAFHQQKWVTPLIILVVLIGVVLAGIFGIPTLQSKPENIPEPAQIPVTKTEQEPTSTKVITVTAEISLTPEFTSTPEATTTPELSIGSSWIRPTDGMTMMYIPAGEFEMGSADGEQWEMPIHTVYLDSFWVDHTEVTNRMYVVCVDAGQCNDPGGDKRIKAEVYPDHPVTANWEMAQNYCSWAGARLITEAEWEKAARGGLVGKEYPWGNEPPTCDAGTTNGAFMQNCPGVARTIEVKSFAPNGFGLYDMAGNVNEWVADYFDETYYENSPYSNPEGPVSGELRILRGGGAEIRVRSGDYKILSRVAYRFPLFSELSDVLLGGIRCAKDAFPQE